MANKINRTDIYPLTTPADDDFVLGTDVSNTTNDPNGETVSFSIADIRGTPPAGVYDAGTTGSWSPPWGDFTSAKWSLSADRTLINPTNAEPGTTRYIFVEGTSSTPRSVSFGNQYYGDLPVSTVNNTNNLLLTLHAQTSVIIIVSFVEYTV